jgi:hypothetical protein
LLAAAAVTGEFGRFDPARVSVAALLALAYRGRQELVGPVGDLLKSLERRLDLPLSAVAHKVEAHRRGVEQFGSSLGS